MAQYIDKDALVTEIRSRLHPVVVPHGTDYDDWDRGADSERLNILSFLNTLEVKEIELSYDDYMRFFAEHPNFPDDWGFDEAWIFAKYFFELGLKAQKGE